MGNQKLEARTDGIQEAYKILAFPGRDLPDQYKNLVYSKWLRSLRYGNEYFKLIESKSYYDTYQKYINLLLNRDHSILRLAALNDDLDVVLGWSLIEKDILHYVHVTNDYRNNGIATSLVPGEINFITHLTKPAMTIWNNKLSGVKFDPFK